MTSGGGWPGPYACGGFESDSPRRVRRRIATYPGIVGGGTPFVPPVTEDVPLRLVETRTFAPSVILERYGRAGDTSD